MMMLFPVMGSGYRRNCWTTGRIYTEIIKMKFTVVTPCYNMATYLERTICSVLNNLNEGDEYFVIDGASTDGSVEIIQRYEDKITGWISEKDDGYAEALSKGFHRATGDLLCWINASDLLLPGSLQKARDILSNTDAEFIFGDDLYISEDDKVLAYSRGKLNNLTSAMLYGGWTPLQDACFWRKELYNRVGGIDISLKYAADYDLFLKLSMSGKTQYAPYIMSAFRRHTNQKSISGASEYKAEKAKCMLRAGAKTKSPLIKKTVLKIYYWTYVRIRARFLNKIWDKKSLHGIDIKDILV